MIEVLKICLDAGHGLETRGKCCPDNSMKEYQFNSAVVKYMIEILSIYPVEILTVHNDNRDVPLQERVSKANAWKADLYVSVHANAVKTVWNDANGIETFCYKAEGESIQLAAELQTQLIRETGRKNRSVKTAPFYVLKYTRMTSVLAECGFMTNREEAELLKSEVYRKKCAQAIVNGLVKVYKLQPKAQPKKEVPKVEQWKIDVIKQAEELGVIVKDQHKPEEPADKAFVVAVVLNALKGL